MQLQHTLDHVSYASSADKGHGNPVWLPLSPAVARFVRGNEKSYPDPSNSVWRCNLCAHHFEHQVLQADAIDHVKKVYVSFPFCCPTSIELGYAATASEYPRSV